MQNHESAISASETAGRSNLFTCLKNSFVDLDGRNSKNHDTFTPVLLKLIAAASIDLQRHKSCNNILKTVTRSTLSIKISDSKMYVTRQLKVRIVICNRHTCRFDSPAARPQLFLLRFGRFSLCKLERTFGCSDGIIIKTSRPPRDMKTSPSWAACPHRPALPCFHGLPIVQPCAPSPRFAWDSASLVGGSEGRGLSFGCPMSR